MGGEEIMEINGIPIHKFPVVVSMVLFVAGFLPVAIQARATRGIWAVAYVLMAGAYFLK